MAFEAGRDRFKIMDEGCRADGEDIVADLADLEIGMNSSRKAQLHIENEIRNTADNIDDEAREAVRTIVAEYGYHETLRLVNEMGAIDRSGSSISTKYK
jgi:hypothetical protein